MKEFFSPKNILLFVVCIFLLACSDDDNSGDGPITSDEPEDSHLFVWNAMNSWYYFQPEVANLQDDVDNNTNEFYDYLNGFSSPENLFESLVVDPYSIITDDYEELGGGLQALYEDFGFEFDGVRYTGSNDPVLGIIQYVFPGSPAEEAGLQRGDLFTKVDGQQLTILNFFDLMLDRESAFDLTMANLEFDEEGTAIITETGEIETISLGNYQKTPVWIQKTFQLNAANNVGYLFYSNFAYNYHEDLIEAFDYFASEGITDLVLDLRYNPGGNVITAQYLASYIHSNNPNKLMGFTRYNSKHSNSDRTLYFQNEIEVLRDDYEVEYSSSLNSLNLNRLFVLTSRNTASASEFIINVLRPYIDVTIIGDETVGKNIGSRPFYDDPSSDYTNKENANDSHTYGLQLIVSKVFNSNNSSDYEAGFEPDILLSEVSYLDDLQPLGDETEPLLARALNEICQSCRVAPFEYNERGFNLQNIDSNHPSLERRKILSLQGLQ